jgi:hypothetical protein
MNETELILYENETIVQQMGRSRYNPIIENNLNIAALEYMVSSFSENEIPVLLISYPLHPTALSALKDNQLEGHNETLLHLESYDGVMSLNYIWNEGWSKDDFYDFEHLDNLGREKLCHLLGFQINEIFGAE